FNSTDRSYLVAIGDSSLYNNGSGATNSWEATGNIAIGFQSLYLNTKGWDNTAIGYKANSSNTFGASNVSLGNYALFYNTSGSGNLALGYGALYLNTTAGANTAVGSASFYFNGGTRNTGLGYNAGYNNTTGTDNTAIGHQSLFSNTSGSYNTAVGQNALFTNTGQSNNTALGWHADVLNNSISGATAIGFNAIAGSSNGMVFGDANVLTWSFARSTNDAGKALQVGGTASNGNGAYLSAGGTWTNTSDVNLKDNIKQVDGREILDKISLLEVSQWEYKNTPVRETHIGPMAQQFKQIFGLGLEAEDKSISTIDPAGIALIGIQEIKKQHEALLQTVEELKSVIAIQQKEIDLLKEKKMQ
ncbi:MAG: tail fiber domain-containing protein, partial [Saprospiraceae bacterium]